MSVSQTASAVGTAAGTSVDNQAVVDYSVGGIGQTAIESSPTGNSTPGAGALTSFLVDDMIDLTVVESGGSYTSVTPGSSAQVLTYTVTNTGNETHDFSLSNANQAGGAGPFGGTDNFDATLVGIYAEDGTTPGFQALEDVDTWVDELAADTSVDVYIVADIPAAQVDTDLSVHALTAQVAVGGGVGVPGADILADDGGSLDDPAVVQTVFADAGTDGNESADDGYLVASASLTITKTSTVISDPVNGGANPKAIPGAIVEYTITVANAAGAGASATGITITDDLDTEITAGTIAFNPDTYAAGEGTEVTAPNINAGAPTSLTNVADGDEGEFNDSQVNTVIVAGIDLAPGETGTVTYRVTVQ